MAPSIFAFNLANKKEDTLLKIFRSFFTTSDLESDCDGLCKGLVHIEVLPLLRRGLTEARELKFLLYLIEIVLAVTFRVVVSDVLLSGDEEDGGILFNFSDLSLPLVAVLNGFVLHGAAEEEQVGVLVDDLTVGAQVVVTARIVDLKLDLLLPDSLDASVNVEHCRLVHIGELVVQVVRDEARFTHGCVTNQHHLDALHLVLTR